ncbi:hypothetical protein MPAN_004460 [Mariniplasma anaerobium]|uniref:Bacterial toxin RNase RnlA/LsoA DBD domain-containing protein n=1 Tax=Mariniplasma anaerobium TaxID=2735436 RepID=A0A7U9TM69_9MOLU|nr:hypothetical protein MPAN_004460 [Mariniplasma anaerobium]
MPIMRVLEGVLRKILVDSGITIKDKQYPFSCFSNPTGVYLLNKQGSLSSDKKAKVERAYDFYRDQRHSVSHSGDYIGAELFTVREVPTLDEAKSVIKEAMMQINLLYS